MSDISVQSLFTVTVSACLAVLLSALQHLPISTKILSAVTDNCLVLLWLDYSPRDT